MVDAAAIASVVGEVVPRIATGLRPDVRAALDAAIRREEDARAHEVLLQLAENDDIARRDGVPLCQDTGTVWVWVELGADERLGADLQALVDQAVAGAYRDAGLRMSVVRDALVDRTNTGDNTPAAIDVTSRPGSGATVHVMLKGGGSDNASRTEMLAPAEGFDGVADLVERVVVEHGPSACPPLVVGVAVGGTFDKVGVLSKRALLRGIGGATDGATDGATGGAHDARLDAYETELLERVNGTGVGPAGLGGRTTALAVNLVTAPCHIAALPVAVNLGCCAMRSASVELS
jgi:tartrate/fumarate subfamily iron-sulfur-dependent hydro-lyase alpha chain